MAVVAVSASLSVYGDASLPAGHVTEVLGVEPTYSHEFGELHRGARMAAAGHTHRASSWQFDVTRTEATADDPHGMRSLEMLTTQFAPLADRLTRLRGEGYDTRVWIYAESNSEQTGFVISEVAIAGLAMMGTPLFGDVFVPDGEH